MDRITSEYWEKKIKIKLLTHYYAGIVISQETLKEDSYTRRLTYGSSDHRM